MSTTTVRIPDELKAELQKISDAEHKPVSDLVRESVKEIRQCGAVSSLEAQDASFC